MGPRRRGDAKHGAFRFGSPSSERISALASNLRPLTIPRTGGVCYMDGDVCGRLADRREAWVWMESALPSRVRKRRRARAQASQLSGRVHAYEKRGAIIR